MTSADRHSRCMTETALVSRRCLQATGEEQADGDEANRPDHDS